MADAQTEAKRFWTMPIKMPHWKSRSVSSRQEQIAGLVVEATAKLAAAKQNADSDRELYNQFIAKTGEEID